MSRVHTHVCPLPKPHASKHVSGIFLPQWIPTSLSSLHSNVTLFLKFNPLSQVLPDTFIIHVFLLKQSSLSYIMFPSLWGFEGGLELCAPKHHVEVLTLVSVNVKMRSYQVRVGQIQWLVSLEEEGNLGRETQRHRKRRPCENGCRDWSDAATSQGVPRIAGTHQRQGMKHETDFSLESGKDPTLLTPWFQNSSFQNCEQVNFCCFKTSGLW